MKLVLRKDTLAELADEDLAAVHGAALPLTPSCPLTLALTERLSQVLC